MNIKGLAQRLGLGYSLARDLMHSDGFPSIIVGRTPCVDDEAFEAWYERQAKHEPIPVRHHGTPKFHSMTRKPQRHKMHVEVMSGAEFRKAVMGK